MKPITRERITQILGKARMTLVSEIEIQWDGVGIWIVDGYSEYGTEAGTSFFIWEDFKAQKDFADSVRTFVDNQELIK